MVMRNLALFRAFKSSLGSGQVYIQFVIYDFLLSPPFNAVLLATGTSAESGSVLATALSSQLSLPSSVLNGE